MTSSKIERQSSLHNRELTMEPIPIEPSSHEHIGAETGFYGADNLVCARREQQQTEATWMSS